MGLPVALDGRDGPRTQASRAFVRDASVSRFWKRGWLALPIAHPADAEDVAQEQHCRLY